MPEVKTEGMSIKEKADIEARNAEAENPDEEEAVEAEPETDADEAAEAEEEPAEPEAKKRKTKSPQELFQAAFSTFVGKAAAIFEMPPADIVVAPHPGVVGIMLPGFAEPRTHENYKTCATCNGIGEVLTGAVTGKHEKDWHVCPDTRCKGNGYWTKASAAPTPPKTGPLAVQPVETGNGEYAEAPAWMGDPTLTPQAG